MRPAQRTAARPKQRPVELIRVRCACALIASLLEHTAVPGWKTKVTHTITLICLLTLAPSPSGCQPAMQEKAKE